MSGGGPAMTAPPTRMPALRQFAADLPAGRHDARGRVLIDLDEAIAAVVDELHFPVRFAAREARRIRIEPKQDNNRGGES